MTAPASQSERTSHRPGPSLAVVFGLALVAAALYGRTLGDDVRLADDRALLARSLSTASDAMPATAFVPLLEATHAVDRSLASPTATHALQWILVWLTACAVFALARRLGAGRGPAAVGAVLMLAHPLLAEATVMLAARGPVLATLLLVLATERLVRWRESGTGAAGMLAVALAIAAVLVHPLASVFACVGVAAVKSRSESGASGSANFVKLGIAAVVGLALVDFGMTIRGGFERIVDRAAVAGFAARDLVLPLEPAAAYAVSDVARSGNGGLLGALAALTIVVAVAIALRMACRGGAIAFAILGLLASFAVMIAFDPSPLAGEPSFADRSMVAVVAWLGIVSAAALARVWRTEVAPVRVAALAVSAVIVVIFGAQTFARALMFESDLLRFEAAARVAPDVPEVRERLGIAWLDHANERPEKTAPQERTRRLRRAAEEIGRALERYEAAGVDEDRTDLRARFAEILGELGLDERALEEIGRALRVLEDRTGEPGAEQRLAEAYRLRGRLHETAGDIDLAERDLRAALDHHETAETRFESGRLAVDRGARLERAERGAGRDFVEAGIRDLDRALDLDPTRLDARIEKARGLVALRQYIRAVTVLEDAIERHPESPRPHYELALTYVRVEDYKGAGTHVTAALQLDPRHVDSLLLLADILRLEGNDRKADEAIGGAYLVHPSREDVRIAWAEVKGRQAAMALDAGQVDEAIRLAREAINIDEHAPAPWIVVGDALVSKREYDKARDELERAYRRFPGETMRRELAMLCRDAGYALLLADERSRALEYFRRAVELLPHEDDFSVLREILSNE